MGEKNLIHLSPNIRKRRRGPSVLIVKKHFRKSRKHDHAELTIPKKSISVIEISSTDSESIEGTGSNTDIDESKIQNTKTQSSKNISDSVEIISPSPEKNSRNLKYLSTREKRANNIKPYRNYIGVKDTDNKQMVKGVCDNVEQLCRDPNTFLEFSILDYDKFQKPKSVSDPLINSTMIQLEEKQANLLETDLQDNSNCNISVESVNKSCENLLDDIYGDSWRPFRDKIFPRSERKPPTKPLIRGKQIPATEKKVKKSESYKNTYIGNGKHESNNLLKALHTNKIRTAIESTLVQNLKAFCDEESSEQSDVAPSNPLPRTKLNFEETQKSSEEEGSDDLKEKVQPKLNKDIDDFCWLDEENSLEKLPLKDRIAKKKLCEEENRRNKKKDSGFMIINENPNCHKYELSDKNDFNTKKKENNDKKKTSSVDEIIDNIMPSKASSSGVSSESNKNGEKDNAIVKKKVPISRNNHKNWENSSGSDESIKYWGGNIEEKGKKRVKPKNLKKFLDSSDSNGENEINKEVPASTSDHSELEKSSGSKENLENIVKKITNKVSKTKISSDSESDSNEIQKKRVGKHTVRKVLRPKTKEKKYFVEDSTDSDNSPVRPNYTVNLTKKTEENKTYSFLASLSDNVPDHQCDPSAKIFKVNFNNNRDNLAKKLFKLYNNNVFDNLIPKSVPLEWNSRMLCTAGYCYSKRTTHTDGKMDFEARIVLSTKVLTTPDRLRDTLIHEMCHAATWLIDNVRDGHGKFWKAWTSKARKVYPELPPIRTCHNYELSSKYVYRCEKCAYEVKRHRKTLDIERKRCGYCGGKFEIFMNKVTKKGERKLIPLVDTPKKEPKGFAAFIQKNYANYKNPQRTPAEVMKLLSSKFKEMKVQ